MEQVESIKDFGGRLNRYQHPSASCHCTMSFSVRVKAGAQRYAAELGIALIMPDTSPRGCQE